MGKFNENKRKKVLILLLIITLSNIIDTNNKEISKNKSKNTLRNKYKNKNLTKFPFQNPIGNLAAGMGETLVGGNQKFMNCFPEKWKEKDPNNNGVMLDVLTKVLGVLAIGLSFFLKIFNPILKVICSHKNTILDFIGNAMGKNLKKYRTDSEEASSTDSSTETDSSFTTFSKNYKSNLQSLNTSQFKLKSRWGLFSAIKDAAKAAEKKLKEAKDYAKKKLQAAKDLIIKKVFDPIFGPIKAKIKELIGKVKSLFMGEFLGTIFKCAKRMKRTLYKHESIFSGMFEKFELMIQYAAQGITKTILFFVDMLLGMICDTVDFRKGLHLIAKGASQSDKNERFFLTGQGLGLILKKFSLKKMRV